MEEIDLISEDAQDSMEKSLVHLDRGLAKIRAGRANPAMLDMVKVDYYGSITPLKQVANINTPDARTLAVQPWEKAMITEIEKAIMNADLGLNPQNNGEIVMINVPVLTEERRRDLVKQARAEGEDAKVSIRAARKDANDMIKKIEGVSEDIIKDAEERIQQLTNRFNKTVEDVLDKKETEIMHV